MCLFTLLTPKMYNSWCKQPEMAMWLCPLQKPYIQLIHFFCKCLCYYPAFERIREVIVFTTSCECSDKLIQLDLSYLFFFFNHIWDVVITLVPKQLLSSAELFILAIIFIPNGFFLCVKKPKPKQFCCIILVKLIMKVNRHNKDDIEVWNIQCGVVMFN